MRVPDPAPVDFDDYDHRYREAVEEAISFSGAELDHFTQAKVNVLLELVGSSTGPPEGLRFLDVGCGSGETDRFLEGRVAGLTGVDIAPKVLERARAQNPWADYQHLEPGGDLPVAESSFDVCFAICVLHHVPAGQRPGLVAEMMRVCRPGGLVAVFEHNPFNPLTRRAVAGCEFDRDAELLRAGQAVRLLTDAGVEGARGRYIVFFTRSSPLRRRIESRLGWLPLGAQYVVSGKRP
jgi:SAM-dependent methyltransferase